MFLRSSKESAICACIPLPLEPPSHPTIAVPLHVITEHRAELPALSQPPTSWLVYTTVCIRQCCSPSSCLLLLPSSPPCPPVHSLHLHLCSCPANRLVCTVFLDSLYNALIYGICFPLTSPCMTDSWFIQVTTDNQFCSFYG